jgi:hypothetical protein
MASQALSAAEPSSVQVQSWRAYTVEEFRVYVKGMQEKREPKKGRNKRGGRPGILVVRDKISTVDMYCYLKARFGEPNGFQTFLAKDDSDNWIHWDYNLKAGDADIHITGMSRETHIMTTERLSDEQWRDLVKNIKADFARVGKDKSAVLKSLERWAVFQNKFVEIANACAEKHALIAEFLSNKPKYFTFKPISKRDAASWAKEMSARNKLRSDMAQACLELSLLTPVMAEAFINMTILMLCKPEIRDNKRQFDVFIRSQIDAKIFDLPYKCAGFVSGIDPKSTAFIEFKRIMDKRNHEIHGNIDPEREKVEVVYFDNKRPLFVETGDHVGNFIESIERQAQPDIVVSDYESTHAFLALIVSCLERDLQPGFWRVMEDAYPGFDAKRKKAGALFPGHVFTGSFEGLRYDSDLAVSW